jgi:hypothetical protein
VRHSCNYCDVQGTLYTLYVQYLAVRKRSFENLRFPICVLTLCTGLCTVVFFLRCECVQ